MFSTIDFTKLLNQFVFSESDPMYFGSALFLFTFFGFLILYHFAVKVKYGRIVSLIFFSFFFYYKLAGSLFLMLIIISAMNYLFAAALFQTEKEKRRLFLIFVAVASNLAFLIYFKYLNFILSNIASFQGKPFEFVQFLAPLGISYYIFKSLSYVLDIYNEMLEEPYSFLEYLFYISFFPSIMSGPIDKARDFLPQVRERYNISKEDLGFATFLLISALIKKNIVADYSGMNFLERVFTEPSHYSGFENLIAVYGYTIRIYCDFSGYTDFALAIGLLLGFRLTENFNAPYFAQSITEFWRRWHISLSQWLLDYLFSPIQMAFRNLKIFGNALAIFITFTLCGFWHGSGWNFILWGALHSLFMIISLFTKNIRQTIVGFTKLEGTIALKIFRGLVTFHLVAIAWVLFGVSSLEKFEKVFNRIFTSFQGHIWLQFFEEYKLAPLSLGIGAIIILLSPFLSEKIKNLIIKMPVYFQAVLLVLTIWWMFQFRMAGLLPPIYLNY